MRAGLAIPMLKSFIKQIQILRWTGFVCLDLRLFKNEQFSYHKMAGWLLLSPNFQHLLSKTFQSNLLDCKHIDGLHGMLAITWSNDQF